MPENLESVNPEKDRFFPSSWRDAAIRELYSDSEKGVICPSCKNILRGLRELRTLHADHIIPWTKGGQTTWENLQLLCRNCNISKSNTL